MQGNLISEGIIKYPAKHEDYLQLKTDAMEAIELYTNTIAKLTEPDNNVSILYLLLMLTIVWMINLFNKRKRKIIQAMIIIIIIIIITIIIIKCKEKKI